MSYRGAIERHLLRYKLMLGIRDDVKVEVRRYRTKAALSNIKTRTIYINKDLLDLGEDVIEYLVLHELLHIKLQSRYHDERFYSMLYFLIPPEKVEAIRRVIMERMVQNYVANGRHNLRKA
jgi:predicted metal-dependent hydrolase